MICVLYSWISLAKGFSVLFILSKKHFYFVNFSIISFLICKFLLLSLLFLFFFFFFFYFFFFLMRILNQMRMFDWLIDWLIFSCVGSSFLCEGPLQLRQAGATPHRDARASHRRGPSRCGAQAPDAQAQQLWLTGPAAPRHVGSPQARARTRVPCISRQTPNHCATWEALFLFFYGHGLALLFSFQFLKVEA